MDQPPRLWPDRAIGSVMPLAAPVAGTGRGDSIWAAWTEGRSICAFQTARSALAAFLQTRAIRRILLPAYACASLGDAARGAACEIDAFAVDAELDVDVGDLAARLRPGDAALAIDYFGRPPGSGMLALVAERRDVLWIEDRAQALDPDAPAWGDAVLYSPRKLAGVADGGVLAAEGPLPTPESADADSEDALWAPQRARLADIDGCEPASWYPAFQAREAGFKVGRSAMSPLTRDLLKALPIAPQADARRRNFAVLAEHLADFALWPQIVSPTFAPLAFPVVAAEAATLHATLAEQRIFCARHWADLTSSAEEHPAAHRLAARCLSIPCEPRYSAEEMHRVGAAVREALRQQA